MLVGDTAEQRGWRARAATAPSSGNSRRNAGSLPGRHCGSWSRRCWPDGRVLTEARWVTRVRPDRRWHAGQADSGHAPLPQKDSHLLPNHQLAQRLIAAGDMRRISLRLCSTVGLDYGAALVQLVVSGQCPAAGRLPMRLPVVLVVLVLAVVLSACAASESPPPAATATPTPTVQDSHLAPDDLVIVRKERDSRQIVTAVEGRVRPTGEYRWIYYVTIQLLDRERTIEVSQSCYNSVKLGDILPRRCR